MRDAVMAAGRASADRGSDEVRQMRHGFTIGCILLAGASVARPVMAQPFTLNDKIKPTEIKLQPYREGSGKAGGRIYGAVITQTQEAQYFFVQGVSIYSPNYVGITADDPSAPVQVSLHKEVWDQPNLRGQTDNAGRWDAKFKTSGDFGSRSHRAKFLRDTQSWCG